MLRLFSTVLPAVLLAALAGPAAAQKPITGTDLWAEYVKSPDTHSNIPNCSYAGVFRGEKPLPAPTVGTDVKQHGAKGDGKADDTEAFKKALQSTAAKGGAVAVPAGTYRISQQLVIPSGVVLRGEGPEKSVLNFVRPLEQILGKIEENKSSVWSWAGGMIWIGSPDTFRPDGKVAPHLADRIQGWEYWRPSATLAKVSKPAKRGDRTVEVDKADGFKPGQFVMLSWENPADASFLKHVAGHPSMEAYNWKSATWILPPIYPRWQWPAEIESVKGNTVTLAQPLRVDIRAEWNVEVADPGPRVENAGVEDLQILLESPKEHKHLKCVGWNGVYFNRAYNCWAKNVRITAAENPVIFSAAKNCTVEKLVIDGDPMNHHSVAMRVNSHDNLVKDFVVKGMWRVKHGINVEWLSSGNVYSKGTMEKGTFDSHRALSFDLIRTEITLTNEADGPGGAGQAGPFIGARVAHWNIRVLAAKPSPTNMNAPGDFVFMPFTFPMGAFVGIQGAEVSNKVRDTTPGEKGSIIADEGVVPAITNLYESQLKLRLFKQ